MASSNPTGLPSYLWAGRAQGRNNTSSKELTRSCNPRVTGNAKFPLSGAAGAGETCCTDGFTHGDPESQIHRRLCCRHLGKEKEGSRGREFHLWPLKAKPFPAIGSASSGWSSLHLFFWIFFYTKCVFLGQIKNRITRM